MLQEYLDHMLLFNIKASQKKKKGWGLNPKLPFRQ